MPMDDVATGIMLGTRSLAMEMLCTVPCGGGRRNDNGRQVWARGASLVEMGKDFHVPTDSIRAVLKELATQYAIRTGNVAPVMLPTGQWVRGGCCAFVEPHDWERVESVCEAYQAEYGDGQETTEGDSRRMDG